MEGIWLVSYIVLWAIVLGLGLLVILLYRQIGQQYLGTAAGVSRDGLVIGTRAPDFTANDQFGKETSLRQLMDGQRYTLLIFGAPTCAPCRHLLPQAIEFQRDNADRVQVIWVNRATDEESQRYVQETDSTLTTLANDGGIMSRYQARVTPFVFVLDPQAMVRAKGLANNRVNLDSYLRQAETGEAQPPSEPAEAHAH